MPARPGEFTEFSMLPIVSEVNASSGILEVLGAPENAGHFERYKKVLERARPDISLAGRHCAGMLIGSALKGSEEVSAHFQGFTIYSHALRLQMGELNRGLQPIEQPALDTYDELYAVEIPRECAEKLNSHLRPKLATGGVNFDPRSIQRASDIIEGVVEASGFGIDDEDLTAQLHSSIKLTSARQSSRFAMRQRLFVNTLGEYMHDTYPTSSRVGQMVLGATDANLLYAEQFK